VLAIVAADDLDPAAGPPADPGSAA